MLKLRQINKTYNTPAVTVKALSDINLNFRKSEFVSILGASGSGKTTLLNIIGGLDNYTSGDLIINNKSTKKYNDYDWDLYRNHSVGFVFQSYNLIPHQTALANVELALTLSGICKTERRQKAIDALKQVGLSDQIYKKPNQMSGGQIQRVAIARAIVNNPEILLADEPTGALDSETSIQIMDLLKSISKDRLVIMVTHNPELAQKYSTRIIRLSDGNVHSDTDCYNDTEGKVKNLKIKKNRKNFMNFKTALGLSLNNLSTKKGRTILTSFAGAIGIIGVALVLSISSGVDRYINSVEENTLSSYPIIIESQKIDAMSMLETLHKDPDFDDVPVETVVTNDIMGNMISMMTKKIEKNDLKKFKEYIEDKKSAIEKYTNAIQYQYNLNLQIYKNDLNNVEKLNPSNIMSSFGLQANEMYASMMSGVFNELIDNSALIEEQYTVLKGKLPEKYNEVVLVVDQNNMISDYTAYSLGLKDKKELQQVVQDIITGKTSEFKQTSYSYDELLNLSFKVLLNTDYYKKEKNIWVNKENDLDYLKSKLNSALEIKVVGIVKCNDESALNTVGSYGGIGYTKELTEYVINEINLSLIAQEQKSNSLIDVFTGKTFDSNEGNEIYSSYESNLAVLGVVDIDNPSVINIYPKDFESKEEIKKFIESYNQQKKDLNLDSEIISYSDYVGLLMNSVTTIIDVISYVLIAFVSVSLIVSSIMIGIITYISVLERTKEIGILRSIGASKKDISRVFNAETFIVGFFAGAIGVLITYILIVPINVIIRSLSGISNMVYLPLGYAIILVVISILLTMIAGLIPSKMASRKDPVEALRID